MNATVNKVTHCSLNSQVCTLAGSDIANLSFWGGSTISMYLNIAATVKPVYLYVHVALSIIFQQCKTVFPTISKTVLKLSKTNVLGM